MKHLEFGRKEDIDITQEEALAKLVGHLQGQKFTVVDVNAYCQSYYFTVVVEGETANRYFCVSQNGVTEN